MAAKQNLRRENSHLVPCPTAYLWGRSSASCQKTAYFAGPGDISSDLTEMA